MKIETPKLRRTSFKTKAPWARAKPLLLRLASASIAIQVSACSESASGTYVGKTNNGAFLIQLVQADKGRLTGRYEELILQANGQTQDVNASLAGQIDGKTVVATMKPNQLFASSLTLSGTLERGHLHLSGGTNGQSLIRDLQRSDEANFRTQVAALRTVPAGRFNTNITLARKTDVGSSAPSFDCTKSSATAERMICQNPKLAIFDISLAHAYDRLLSHSSSNKIPEIKITQKAWISQRNKCESDNCLESSYANRLDQIARQLSLTNKALSKNLRIVGNCETTSVDELGYRRLDEPSSGSKISFADGIGLVSYETVPAITASRIGDKAKICLVSIPTNCPAGDDRGRVYGVTNLRTGGRWNLPDSQHGCGGA